MVKWIEIRWREMRTLHGVTPPQSSSPNTTLMAARRLLRRQNPTTNANPSPHTSPMNSILPQMITSLNSPTPQCTPTFPPGAHQQQCNLVPQTLYCRRAANKIAVGLFDL